MPRQPVAMIHVGIPLDLNEFNTEEEHLEALQKAVELVSYPDNARVQAWFSYLPELRPMVVDIQDGFYAEHKDPINLA